MHTFYCSVCVCSARFCFLIHVHLFYCSAILLLCTRFAVLPFFSVLFRRRLKVMCADHFADAVVAQSTRCVLPPRASCKLRWYANWPNFCKAPVRSTLSLHRVARFARAAFASQKGDLSRGGATSCLLSHSYHCGFLSLTSVSDIKSRKTFSGFVARTSRHSFWKLHHTAEYWTRTLN